MYGPGMVNVASGEPVLHRLLLLLLLKKKKKSTLRANAWRLHSYPQWKDHPLRVERGFEASLPAHSSPAPSDTVCSSSDCATSTEHPPTVSQIIFFAHDGTRRENEQGSIPVSLTVALWLSAAPTDLKNQFAVKQNVLLLCHWTVFSIAPAGWISMRSKTTSPRASPALLLPVFFEVLYIWISCFTAPPQHVHFQLPVSVYNLFLSTFSTKRNKTEGGQPRCMWGGEHSPEHCPWTSPHLHPPVL